MARLDAFLQLGREQGCSDIHLAVGLPPLLRMHGELTPVKYRSLAPEELDALTAAGARTVRLGDTVLRTSTAGPAALAVVSAALGRW